MADERTEEQIAEQQRRDNVAAERNAKKREPTMTKEPEIQTAPVKEMPPIEMPPSFAEHPVDEKLERRSKARKEGE